MIRDFLDSSEERFELGTIPVKVEDEDEAGEEETTDVHVSNGLRFTSLKAFESK